jgi:hypothetical protein
MGIVWARKIFDSNAKRGNGSVEKYQVGVILG